MMDCPFSQIPARYISNAIRMEKSYRLVYIRTENLFATLTGITIIKQKKAVNPLKKESFMFKSSNRSRMAHGIETANMPVTCLWMRLNDTESLSRRLIRM